jgi:hypothetical protein
MRIVEREGSVVPLTGAGDAGSIGSGGGSKTMSEW